MAYATQADLVDRYGDESVVMTFDRQGLGEAQAVAVTKALADAASEIDGYLAGVYSLPLTVAPANLTLLCCDIAMYRGAKGPQVTEELRKRYEDAVRYLTKVGEGRIKLFQDEPAAPQGGSGADFSAAPRRFNRQSMGGLR